MWAFSGPPALFGDKNWQRWVMQWNTHLTDMKEGYCSSGLPRGKLLQGWINKMRVLWFHYPVSFVLSSLVHLRLFPWKDLGTWCAGSWASKIQGPAASADSLWHCTGRLAPLHPFFIPPGQLESYTVFSELKVLKPSSPPWRSNILQNTWAGSSSHFKAML